MNREERAKVGEGQDPVEGHVVPNDAMLSDELASQRLVDGLVREDVTPMALKGNGGIGRKSGGRAIVGDDVGEGEAGAA